MEYLSILIVEDDYEIQKNFSDLSEKYENIKIIGITSSSAHALDIMTSKYPDVIILDLELHNGKGNGIDVLHGLKHINYKPFIAVTTNNSSKVIHNSIRKLGTDYIFSKHQTDYSEKLVLDFLISMEDTIKNNFSPSNFEFESPEVLDLKNKEIVRKAHKEFSGLGIASSNRGHKYLTEAIRLNICGQFEDINTICTIIGDKEKKSRDSVVRAMQNAIDRAWKTSDPEDLSNLFHGYVNPNRGSPTITEFISYYANEISSSL